MEKKFTGQRKDATGLYYYGARACPVLDTGYYDAGIGRFISPDTVVQDPSNPQTLNRYSYCINNPLKYTDPTGLYFDAGNHQKEVDAALDAIVIDHNIPRWIIDYIQLLRDSKIKIGVYFDATEAGEFGLSSIGEMPAVIPLANDYGNDTGLLASDLAHEAYHVYEGHLGATIEEEERAYIAEYYVGTALNWKNPNETSIWIFGLQGNPSDNAYLQKVYYELRKGDKQYNHMYSVMPLRQSQLGAFALAKQLYVATTGHRPGFLGGILCWVSCYPLIGASELKQTWK